MKKKTFNFPFISAGLPFILFSLAMMAFCVYTWVAKGESKYGIDFQGGTEVIVRFEQKMETASLRDALASSGFSSAVVQSFKSDFSDFSVRLNGGDEQKVVTSLKETFSKLDPSYQILKQDYVGPIIGEQIRVNGFYALIISLVAILLYVSFRFEWPYAIGAVAALTHDVIITAGLYVFFDKEVTSGVLASLLTIVGYSLNDTIVIFDRIRENFSLTKTGKTKDNLAQIVNRSINETLSRTILTSLTVFFVVVVLWLMGGGAIQDLAFSLVIGVIAGTYSTVFIASPILVALQRMQLRRGTK